MTATVLFERLRQLKPVPAEIDDTILLDWLNQVEGQILHEIFLLALSSTSTVTCLPLSAAFIRAAMMGDWPLTR